MKVELELMKDPTGKHFLMMKIGTADDNMLTSMIPMEADPLYVLYKKLTTEFHHYDATLNQAGLDFKAQQAVEAAKAVESGSQEQNPVPAEPSQAAEVH